MKGRTFFAAAGLALGVMAASTAGAQASSAAGMQFGVSAGASIPMGDFGDEFGTGFNVMGHLGINPASMPVGFRADVGYSRFGASDFDANASVINALANAIVKVPMQGSSIAPYLLGGVGIANVKLSGDDVGDDISSTGLAFDFGGGLQFNLSGMATNLEVAYVRNGVDEDKFGDSSANAVRLSFGVMFGR